ncbi:hypothetical protein BDZ89DRAFT_961193, partial [Hymenopellis radicata]
IYCEDSRCRWSPFHPINCTPPRCLRTCQQYKKFPEQYNPHINAYCSHCNRRQQQQQNQSSG